MARAPTRRLVSKSPIILVCTSILVALYWSAASADRPADQRRGASAAAPTGTARSRPARTARHDLPPTFRIRDATREGERYRATLADGARVDLTIDADLQSHLARELARYEVPFGAAVAIEPSTGRVLAYVSHSSADARVVDRARLAAAPSASVFKLVTASALIENGVSGATRVCYGGGLHGLTARDLTDDPGRDRTCATLTEALSGSINAVFAKLSDRHLDRGSIVRYASAFGYGESLPFDLPVDPSGIEIPDDRLERARAAAGFYHSQLSPFHGALIAATIANGGSMMRASMVERVTTADGRTERAFAPSEFRRVIGRDTATSVGRMMERTISAGTARSAFFDPRGNAFLPNIRVAGKTGTLDDARGAALTYTWFVGYAPADRPTIAIATLVVNRPEWRIKASYLAREGLRHYLRQAGRTPAAAATH